ncbi:hypothetical protein ACFV5J_36215 [Streptomyces zaomyceticus]|uniref:hypothetical protein n=1 Tax=Streptomyces zaomyceticus TaxID=68286 RepID=UPI0036491A24
MTFSADRAGSRRDEDRGRRGQREVAAARSGPGAAGLTEREAAHRLVASQPYLFVSHGRALTSGIEDVAGDAPDGVLELPVAVGRHAVVVHLIDWQAEAGSRDEKGRPATGALPDLVVLINPAPPRRETFRTAPTTFEAPNG